jgi:hypothetical protein
MEADVEWATGHLAWRRRRLDEARQHFARSLDIEQRMGERFVIRFRRLELAQVAIDAKHPGAGAALRDALGELWAIRDWHFWQGAELAAIELGRVGRTEAAAVVLGYLEAQGIRHGGLARRRQRALDRLEHLAESAAWMHRGAELGRDQLVTYLLAALEDLGDPGPLANETVGPTSTSDTRRRRDSPRP